MDISSKDLELLRSKIKNKQEVEQLKILFDWFVENWSYKGYNKLEAGFSNEADKDFPTCGPLGCLAKLRFFSQKEKEELKLDQVYSQNANKTSMQNLCLALADWAANLTKEDIDYIVQRKPFLVPIINCIRDNADNYKQIAKRDEQEKICRAMFLESNTVNYIGVCIDFSKNFADVCNTLGINSNVICCYGEIFNGTSWVYHAFNAVVNLDNQEVKYIDLSFAIHAKEQKQGYAFGEKYKSEDPDDFFMKSRKEIKKAEGRDRVYKYTDEELIEKVKNNNIVLRRETKKAS